ncbi:MAG: 50S ribosomal protein L32 [Phycisphaera sp. TMED9]|nr:MAG: 50S ribosomal protein L32 [Phycisphaera sp. TMED9]
MPVPSFRQSPGRTRRRRAHDAIERTHTVLCPNCGTAKRPHHACRECGYVRPGLQVKPTKPAS